MRVLHVINDLATGGAETVLYRLTTYPSDVEHEIICLQDRSSYSDRLDAHGIRVHHLDWFSPARSLRPMAHLCRLMRESRADVVQAWMYRSNILAAFAGKLAGIPVIWNIRSTSVKALRPPSRMLAYTGGFLARWFPAAIINCSLASQQLHARLGYDSVDGTVISNGYDPNVFYPDEAARAATRASLGREKTAFLIGSIGRWDSHKGYPILLQALRILRDRGLSLRMLLVGRGLESSNSSLARLIQDCDCADLVEAIGERADIPDLARALDLHVLASISEGFPNVVAETMLSETPNVVTNVGDAALIVGEAGWVVPAADAQSLAEAIEAAHNEWSTSSRKWRNRRAAARHRIVENFSLDRMVAAYHALWRQVARNVSSTSSRRDGPKRSD
jgi:glycosyltransferase involved in cell wall biosynthesis